MKVQIRPQARNSTFSPSKPPKYLVLMAFMLALSCLYVASLPSEPRNPNLEKLFSRGKPKEPNLSTFKTPFLLSSNVMNKIMHILKGNQRNRGKTINMVFGTRDLHI
jgi:hypothetical protein